MKKAKRSGIFICYRRDDVPAVAGRIFDQLSDKFPQMTHIDVHSIPPGTNFQEAIKEILERCAAMVVVIGPEWARLRRTHMSDAGGRDSVFEELEQAFALNLYIVPVLVDVKTMPEADLFPASLRSFNFHNALHLESNAFSLKLEPLEAALYKALNLREPSWGENVLAAVLGCPVSNEVGRRNCAFQSIGCGIIALAGLGSPHAWGTSFLLGLLAIGTAIPGYNARGWRCIAALGFLLGLFTVIALGFLLLQAFALQLQLAHAASSSP